VSKRTRTEFDAELQRVEWLDLVSEMKTISWSAVVVLAVVVWAPACVGGDGPRRCQKITVPMCLGVGYNLTYMPNVFSHETQDEAGLEVHQFWPLVEIECSPHLRLFLCRSGFSSISMDIEQTKYLDT